MKYGIAMAPLPSLAAGGDVEDTDTGDEVVDVWERDLVLVFEAEAIQGYEQHHGLRGAWRAAVWQRTPWSRR